MGFTVEESPRAKFNTKAQEGFGLFGQPLSTQASIFGPLVGAALPLASSIFDDPANIRGARRFFSGDVSTATNEFFKPQEMDLIKEAARGALAENRDYLDYGDWDRAAGKPWQSDPDPKNWSALLDKVRDPAEIMQTTLGGVGGFDRDIYGIDSEGQPYQDAHFPGLGIINKPVGPTGRYNEPHLTLRDVWDVNPGGQPSQTNPFYQAILNLGEHITTTQGSQHGFPFDLDLGLASDYDIPYMSLDGEDRYELQDWENQSPDWYVPRYPTKEAPPAVTWGEGNILQRARNPNLSAVSQALTPYEIMSSHEQEEAAKTYIQEAIKHIGGGATESGGGDDSGDDYVVTNVEDYNNGVVNDWVAPAPVIPDIVVPAPYTSPLSNQIGYTGHVDDFSSVFTPTFGTSYEEEIAAPDYDPWAFEDRRGGRR